MAWQRRSKFRAQKTKVDGIVFASKKEAKRYGDLLILAKVGRIQHLTLQPKYPIVVNGTKVCTYIGDFQYWEDGRLVLEDVKGMKTPVYNLKKKLVHACYGIKILET